MIYKSLDILPFKLFLEIQKTGDVTLLSDEQDPDLENLNVIWKELKEKHDEISPNNEVSKNIKIASQVEYFKTRYKSIVIACEALRFQVHEDLIEMLIDYGYKISFENYHSDLDRIEQEANALLIKADRLKEHLPKNNDDSDDIHIDDIMASYSLIIGFDFDYNSVSVSKFYAIEKQVDAKIKSLEKNAK